MCKFILDNKTYYDWNDIVIDCNLDYHTIIKDEHKYYFDKYFRLIAETIIIKNEYRTNEDYGIIYENECIIRAII